MKSENRIILILLILLLFADRRNRRKKKKTRPKHALFRNPHMFLDGIADEKYPYLFGLTKPTFDAVLSDVSDFIEMPRNVRGVYSDEQNVQRKFRKCLYDTPHRFALWLEQMKHGIDCTYLSNRVDWCVGVLSDDFTHITLQFVTAMDWKWIRPLTAEEIELCKGQLMEFPDAVACLDGKQFQRRATVKVPNKYHRKELYGYKHRTEVDNSVAEVNILTGMCTDLCTGVLGATPDSTAARFLDSTYINSYETLVDGAYGNISSSFIMPLRDGSEKAQFHKRWRATAEHFWSRVYEWKIVGEKYRRDSALHPLVIRAACILTNIKIALEEKCLRDFN